MNDIAVITSVFNPVGFEQPRENFKRFTAGLESDGVPWYAIELAFFDEAFSLPTAPNIFKYRSNSIMWHKEHLLNVLASKLPREIKKIVWADCDLLFSSPDWWKKTSEMLEEKVLVQPFDTALWWNLDGETTYRKKTSFVHYYLNQKPAVGDMVDWPQCHPGFVWAARREFFERGGLYPFNIMGGADLCMSLAFTGLRGGCHWNPKVQECLKSYAETMAWIDRRLGYLPDITVNHLWHGDLKHRQHAWRRKVVRRNGFDPRVDISLDANGMLQWATDKKVFHNAVYKYFRQRKEDPFAWRKFWQSCFRLGGFLGPAKRESRSMKKAA